MTTESKTTPAKLAANRANAKKSTGPRTAAGKAASRVNRLRHGLRAELVVVPPLESPDEWEAHRAAVLESLSPANYLEALVADRAALAMWRLQRAARYERAVLVQAQSDAEKKSLESQYIYDDGDRVKNLEDAARNVRHYRDAISALELLPEAEAYRELENGYAFELVKRVAARISAIPLVTLTLETGEEWEDLPEDVYAGRAGDGDYPTFGELAELVEAITKHDARRDVDDLDVPQRTLRELRYRLHVAKQNEAKLAEAIAGEREKYVMPTGFAGHDGRRHDELLARYEASAERSLERSLANLQLLRTGLGSVGKDNKVASADRADGERRAKPNPPHAKIERPALPPAPSTDR